MKEDKKKGAPTWLWLVVFLPSWLIVRSILGVDGWAAILVAGVFGVIVNVIINLAYTRMS